MNPGELQQHRSVFAAASRGSNALRVEDLSRVCDVLNKQVSKQMMQKALAPLDSVDGTVDFRGFLQLLVNIRREENALTELEETFKIFLQTSETKCLRDDHDMSLQVTPNQLYHRLAGLVPEGEREERARKMMQFASGFEAADDGRSPQAKVFEGSAAVVQNPLGEPDGAKVGGNEELTGDQNISFHAFATMVTQFADPCAQDPEVDEESTTVDH